MATCILLLRLTPEGRANALSDPESLLRAEEETSVRDLHGLGLYGVIGEYDFVSILGAPDNEEAARFSLEFGGKAGLQVETLPAVPITEFEARGDADASEDRETMMLPGEYRE